MMLRDKGFEEDGMARDAVDARIEQALGEFRTSVKAWSEAALRQPMAAIAPARRAPVWKGVLAWSMGMVLAAGVAAGGIYERYQQQEVARQVKQRYMEQEQRAQAAQRAAEMDQLMANVDSDVSQEVPDALEPLAQMMTVSGSN